MCPAARDTRSTAAPTTARRRCARGRVRQITETGQEIPQATLLDYPDRPRTCLNSRLANLEESGSTCGAGRCKENASAGPRCSGLAMDGIEGVRKDGFVAVWLSQECLFVSEGVHRWRQCSEDVSEHVTTTFDE